MLESGEFKLALCLKKKSYWWNSCTLYVKQWKHKGEGGELVFLGQ